MDTLERKQQMINMRYELNMSLEEIGEKFGISKQRVNQVIGNTGNIRRRANYIKNKEYARRNLDETSGRLARKLGVNIQTVRKYRRGLRNPIDYNDDIPIVRGIMAEEWAIDKLKSMGFDAVGMPHGSMYDIKINGCRLDVKYCTAPSTPPSLDGRQKSPMWRFKRNPGENRCDFFFCITGNDDVFIIPEEKIRTGVNFTITYPTRRPSMGKYLKYKDRYDLISDFLDLIKNEYHL